MRDLRRSWRGMLVAGVVLASGCGAPGGEATTSEDGASSQAATSSALSLPTFTPAETSLIRFWALDRFAYDGKLPAVPPFPTSTVKRLARAPVDECFTGVGNVPGTPSADGTCSVGQPRINDAYVWGLTRAGDNLFFGTLANTLCLVEEGFLGATTPQVTSKWVCEYGQTKSPHAVPGMPGDDRPPNIYKYATKPAPGTLVPLVPLPSASAEMLRRYTVGLRSAGSLGGTVFLAGPAAAPPGKAGGINLFAFDASGSFLGAQNLGAGTYTNVRQWVVANGVLYVGVGTSTGGAVLRWSGDPSGDLFGFTEVGDLSSDAANMALHTDGRIYVTTWPVGGKSAGLYRSPVIPPGGLTAANKADPDWKKSLWLASQYDPDPVTALTIGGGAIASFNGKLVFGTMSVPMVATEAAVAVYRIPSSGLMQTFLGTHRAIAVFSVTTTGAAPKVDMLYGEKYLPVFEDGKGYTIAADAAHRTGFTPLLGASGFGNAYNAYTWAMAVHRNQLYVGTFDWSQVARTAADGGSSDPSALMYQALLSILGSGMVREGADLVRFSPFGNLVFAESLAGLGNDRNYGFRNMLSDGTSLYVGTANPMNLDPKGGWELLKLQ